MSADNGLIITEGNDSWEILEFNASTESMWSLAVRPTLEEAVKFANRYMHNNIVEYGMRVEFKEEHDQAAN